MSVIIKGMNMPKLGDVFRVGRAVDGNLFICNLSAEETVWFPLVEVPTPHGRLIDADAFEARARAVYCDDCDRRKGVKNGKVRMVYEIGDVPCRACETGDMLCDIDDYPTVIEAEE